MAADDEAALLCHRYVELLDDGTPETYGSDAFLSLCAPDLAWFEAPTLWQPEGRSGGLDDLRAVVAGDAVLFHDRHAELHDCIADGGEAAIRYTRRLTIAAEDLPFPRGATVIGEVAAFIEVRNGKIIELREYPSCPRVRSGG
jgi:ketosteroid isomerase-like protein